MAAPLKDFRGKITAEADCVLEAMNRVSGKAGNRREREGFRGSGALMTRLWWRIENALIAARLWWPGLLP